MAYATHPDFTKHDGKQTADNNAIRPFHVDIPEADLADLRGRLTETRLPERETCRR